MTFARRAVIFDRRFRHVSVTDLRVRLNRHVSSGYVGILSVELHFPEAGSLKGKRKYVKSAKAQLQHRFGASVAEVDHHDLWQRARLTVACVARGHTSSSSCSTAPSATSPARSGSSSVWRGRWSTPMTERMRRVNESIRQVLSEALPELKDPRIGFVTVTGVATTRRPPARDRLRQRPRLRAPSARRRSAGCPRRTASCRRAIARELKLKRTPQLTFEYDPSVEQGVRMTKLIDDLAPGPDDSDDDEPAADN